MQKIYLRVHFLNLVHHHRQVVFHALDISHKGLHVLFLLVQPVFLQHLIQIKDLRVDVQTNGLRFHLQHLQIHPRRA